MPSLNLFFGNKQMGGLFRVRPFLLSVTNDRRRFVVLREGALLRSGMENQKQYESSDDNTDDDEDHSRASKARSLLRRQDGRIHSQLDADYVWTVVFAWSRCMAAGVSSKWVSRAKCPVSRKVADGLWAITRIGFCSGGMKNRSLLPHILKLAAELFATPSFAQTRRMGSD